MARKTKRNRDNDTYIDLIMDSPIAIVVVAVLAMLLGIVFAVSEVANKPISREEAIAYSGTFDHYDATWENYREICFEDGSAYDVYAHTETQEFREMMESLKKGTKLYILVNPNNELVAEIKTDTRELLNFETSQREVAAYGNGYVVIGMVSFAGGIFLIFYAVGVIRSRRKEEARHAAKKDQAKVLRFMDTAVKSRTLLEVSVQGYQICYRRIKSTNELVVNGRVYDEMKAVIEFEHRLCTEVDGHRIEAGLDHQDHSYILFDGEIIEEKKRWI